MNTLSNPSCAMSRRWYGLLAAGCLALTVVAGSVRAQPQGVTRGTSTCGSLSNAYGPLDYRSQRGALQIVEQYHLTPLIENSVRPNQYTYGDIDYTLRASPNHHRALLALSRYALSAKSDRLPNMNWSIDCYFERAMRFARDDAIVRMIYAGHLGHLNRRDEALAQLDYVAQGDTDNPFTHYNLGLLYLELGRHDKALAQAHVAMRMGLPRTELRDALKKAGKWVEPPQAAAPADPAASAAGPAS